MTLRNIPRFLISPEFVLVRVKASFYDFEFQNPLLLSDEFESELSKLGKSSITELEIAEILFGQAEHIYQEHRNYRKDFSDPFNSSRRQKGARESILKTKYPLNPKKVINLPSDGNGSSVQKKMWMAIKYYKLEGNSILKTLELPQGLDGSQGHMSVDLFEYVATTVDSVVSFNCMSSIGMLLS